MQISLFDGTKKFKIDKPIRLISLFSGYDSQFFSLKYLGADVEIWRTCEWAVKSIQALKDAHYGDDNTNYSKDLKDDVVFEILHKLGISANYNEPMTYEQIKRLGIVKARQIYNNIRATHNMVNIQQVHAEDLGIEETDKYCYVMTYSFPCQDLSLAGKGARMEKGSGTRSGMLWEVERILEECKELPQVLLMENVPEVIGTNNIKHFAKWLEKLESLGYHCYWEVLNAKDYGVPQNRERCFMVGILGDYYYEFPEPIKLEHRLKDLLEENVDEKYYLSNKALIGKLTTNFCTSKLENVLPKDGICPTLCARDYKDPKCVEITQGQSQGNRVYDVNGLSVTLNANGGGLGAKTGLYLEPVICASRGRNPQNPSLRKSGEPTEQRIEVNPSGCSNTLTTVQKDNYVLEPRVLGGIGEKKSNGGTQWYQQDRIYDENCAISITTGFNPYYAIKSKNKRIQETAKKLDLSVDGQYMDIFNQTNKKDITGALLAGMDAHQGNIVYADYRIRKLTPKECFRLMGVRDEDFEKIAKNQSNASLYHLAGDSICISVLMAIFSKMLEITWEDKYGV